MLTLDIKISGQVRMQNNRIPKCAFLRNFLELNRKRVETRPQSLHEEAFLLCGKRDEGAKLCGVGGDGFLAEDVFAGEEGGFGVGVVVGVWCACRQPSSLYGVCQIEFGRTMIYRPI